MTRSLSVSALWKPHGEECWSLALLDISVRKCKERLVPTFPYALDLLLL